MAKGKKSDPGLDNGVTDTIGPVQVNLFGPFKLITSDCEEISLSNRRARALLAMLCLAPDELLERDLVSKLLWPGRFQVQARASLCQCLFDLSKILDQHGTNLRDVTRSRVSLNRSAVTSDLCKLENALAAGAYAEAGEQLMLIGSKPLLAQMAFGE